jgi:hypothetical protein
MTFVRRQITSFQSDLIRVKYFYFMAKIQPEFWIKNKKKSFWSQEGNFASALCKHEVTVKVKTDTILIYSFGK